MQVTQYVGGSCALGFIQGLGDSQNAFDAMQTFCKSQLGTKSSFKEIDWHTLVNNYIFIAGPEVPSTHPHGSHHSKDHWVTYGTDFAAFIELHNLGAIVTLGPKYNKKHHPTTTAQTWLWSPGQRALGLWWKKNYNTLTVNKITETTLI